MKLLPLLTSTILAFERVNNLNGSSSLQQLLMPDRSNLSYFSPGLTIMLLFQELLPCADQSVSGPSS